MFSLQVAPARVKNYKEAGEAYAQVTRVVSEALRDGKSTGYVTLDDDGEVGIVA